LARYRALFSVEEEEKRGKKKGEEKITVPTITSNGQLKGEKKKRKNKRGKSLSRRAFASVRKRKGTGGKGEKKESRGKPISWFREGREGRGKKRGKAQGARIPGMKKGLGKGKKEKKSEKGWDLKSVPRTGEKREVKRRRRSQILPKPFKSRERRNEGGH